MGAIVRTSATGKDEEEIKKGFRKFNKKWNEIISIEFSSNDYPKLIYKANEILDKLLIDIVDKGLEKFMLIMKKLKN